MSNEWWGGIVAAIVAAGVAGLVVRYFPKWGLVDDPEKHRHPKVIHERAVPRGGGVVIWAAVMVGALGFLPLDKRLAGILLGTTILMGVGIVDDIWQEKFSPYVRLGFNILAAMLVIGAGVGIAYITNPWGGVIWLDWPRYCWEGHCVWLLADLFALIWLVWTQNVVGWSSGVDGQLPGFVIIAAVTMGVLAARFNDPSQMPVITLAAIVAGAYAGFLLWNWYPQKIMPGYGGKSLAGYLLGVLAILSSAKVGALLLVLGVPFVDAAWVIIKRLREGRSPVWGGYEHLHHFLLSMGWGRRRIAIFYWLISGTMAMAAVRLKAEWKWFTMATAGLVISGIIAWLHYFSTFSKRLGRDSG